MASGNYGWNIKGITQDFLDNERETELYQAPDYTSDASDDEKESVTYPDSDSSSESDDEDAGSTDLHIPAHQGHFWCSFNGATPAGAVRAGVDKDGSQLFVGRAFHQGEMLPAKAVPSKGVAYIAWGGEEHAKDEFEILCHGGSSVVWQECSGGQVPPNALSVGRTSENERLFVGRVFHDGTCTPGKIQPSHGVCYVPYDGSELTFPNYEALILM